MTSYILGLIAGTALICSIVYLVRMGCRAIIELSRQNSELNQDQKHGYKLPDEAKPAVRDCPQWMRREVRK